MNEAGLDRPEEGSPAQVTPIARGISLDVQIEESGPSTLGVRMDDPEFARKMEIKRGDRVEVFWRTLEIARALPAQVEEVQLGPDVRWELRIVGPSEPSQRRQAVRAHVELPARARVHGTDLSGRTIDLSEAGSRILFDGWGLPPEAGTMVALVIELGGTEVTTKARVVRTQLRGVRWLISFSHVETTDDVKNDLRRRVFQALREERAARSQD
jgi:hypothetical protein